MTDNTISCGNIRRASHFFLLTRAFFIMRIQRPEAKYVNFGCPSFTTEPGTPCLCKGGTLSFSVGQKIKLQNFESEIFSGRFFDDLYPGSHKGRNVLPLPDGKPELSFWDESDERSRTIIRVFIKSPAPDASVLSGEGHLRGETTALTRAATEENAAMANIRRFAGHSLPYLAGYPFPRSAAPASPVL